MKTGNGGHMSRNPEETTERVPGIGDAPFMQVAAQPYATALQMLGSAQAEWLRFFARRVAKNLDLARRWTASETYADAAAAGAAFAIETATDYANESTKLFAVAAGNFESTAASVI
jgi:hypothetical protein